MKILNIIRNAEPTSEPVGLKEAKTHLRIDGTASDWEIPAMISAARGAAEEFCNRYWAECTVTVIYDTFPLGTKAIDLPFPDVQSVTSITYLVDDLDTALGTSPAEFTLDSERQRITTILSAWPTGTLVKVKMVVGAVPPQMVKNGMLILIGDLFENRQAQAIQQLYDNRAAFNLMIPHRVRMGI